LIKLNKEYLEIGFVIKSHGLRGEVLVKLTTNLIEQRSSPGEVYLINNKEFVLESSKLHSGKWLFKFVGIKTREQAQALAKSALMALPIEVVGKVMTNQLIGKTLKDQTGQARGEITAILENPASDLLELDDGRLVPMQFFVKVVDDEVLVEVPDGIFEL